jgi:hypothetical protein
MSDIRDPGRLRQVVRRPELGACAGLGPIARRASNGVGSLETVIRSVAATHVEYDRTPAETRDARERDLRALLEWRQPDL